MVNQRRNERPRWQKESEESCSKEDREIKLKGPSEETIPVIKTYWNRKGKRAINCGQKARGDRKGEVKNEEGVRGRKQPSRDFRRVNSARVRGMLQS